MPPPADGSSMVAYHFIANQVIQVVSVYVYIKIAADLHQCADWFAVHTSLVAGSG